ncbi:deleted in malignant brain tumors 1 protein-like [Heptranchias perlo]|uniref:deleted in malignant brain tumors 1 protein-like n=1 Tax=Heptranchias perlo TaxID=212740 RepID=UPI0035598D49
MMINEMMIGEMMIGEMMINEMMVSEMTINEMLIGEMMIGEMMISEMMIGEMIINEMMIGEMMIGEMMINEMMINEFDLSPRKRIPRFSTRLHHPSPGYSDILHLPHARSVTGFLFRLTQAIGLSGEGGRPGNSQAERSETVKLRLVNGDSPCAGRVEIHYGGRWGTVLDHSWDLLDAIVVCRELGCGAALSAPGGAHFGEGPGPIVTYNVRSIPRDIKKWLSALDTEKATGPDNIPAVMLKTCAPGLALPPAELFQDSCNTGISPTKWNIAQVRPVHKEQDKSDLVNYSPISPFSIISLVIKEVIKSAVKRHLLTNNVLSFGSASNTRLQTSLTNKGQRAEFQRLVFGDSPCSGRLEVQYGETWGSVCDLHWDLNDANVVCAQLQCGVAVSVPRGAYFGESTGIVRSDTFQCKGNETSLRDCPLSPVNQQECTHRNDASVICSGNHGPRLVGGESRCSGRVEVLHGDQWGTVCDIYFGLEDASVVCEHLQCGAVIASPGGAHFGEGTGPVWKENYRCRGNESRLWDCPVSSWDQFNCLHGNDASVICSDEGWPPRLMNGGSRCDGRVEIYSNSSWGRYGEGEGPVWVNEVQCEGNESRLWDCSSFTLNQSLTDSEDVGVLCSEHKQIRLVDGGSPCAGRVEMYYNGAWGTVCDDSWDRLDADVVCRQLGCGYSLTATAPVSCGQASGPIWLDELRCTGNESVLWECDSSPWGEHDCIHKEDVRIVCSEHKEIRLVKGHHPCEGRVEVFYRGSWGTVCYDDWDKKDGEVVCKQLDCGSVTEIPFEAHFGEGTGPIWLDNVECRSDESFLWQCLSTPWGQHDCKHREDAGVVCSGNQSSTRSDSFHSCPGTPDHTSDHLTGQQLRLVGGKTNCSGRVDIMFNNTWGTVCDDSWDRREARVVCRQLDCGSALADSGEPVYGKGEGPVWLNRVQCKGSELFLWDCRSSTWAQRVCAHKVASVMCSVTDVLIPGVIISTPVAVSIILGTLLVFVLIALTVQQQRQSSRRGTFNL